MVCRPKVVHLWNCELYRQSGAPEMGLWSYTCHVWSQIPIGINATALSLQCYKMYSFICIWSQSEAGIKITIIILKIVT